MSLSEDETHAAARRRVEGWSAAWPEGDADVVAALYAEEALLLEERWPGRRSCDSGPMDA